MAEKGISISKEDMEKFMELQDKLQELKDAGKINSEEDVLNFLKENNINFEEVEVPDAPDYSEFDDDFDEQTSEARAGDYDPSDDDVW